jgi:hypothetical protein
MAKTDNWKAKAKGPSEICRRRTGGGTMKPEMTFAFGSCRASIFSNKIEKNGSNIVIPKIAIAKRYKDNAGEWQTSSNLDLNDLPKMILALSNAYTYLVKKSAENSS